MAPKNKIITVGLCPCWDVTCRLAEVDWGQHTQIREKTAHPAGKALNVSRALHWLGQPSIAAGLWGKKDYPDMQESLRPFHRHLQVHFTGVTGQTRQNITIIDEKHHREMHLRAASELTSKASLGALRRDLRTFVSADSFCVFAGSLPQGRFLPDTLAALKTCQHQRAHLVIDTSGEALPPIVATGGIKLLKPNVQELAELLGKPLADTPAALVPAGRELLDRVEIILISRGPQGAIVVTRQGAWQGHCQTRPRKVDSTVACGDYLLAGFLSVLAKEENIPKALKTALQVATAKAWGWVENHSWPQARRKLPVIVKSCSTT